MRRNFFQQAWHIVYEVGFVIGSLVSRVINAAVLHGSMHQTTSARAYLEANPASGKASRAWRRFNAAINAVFWALSFGRITDHTRQARDADVIRIKRALHRYGEGSDPDA